MDPIVDADWLLRNRDDVVVCDVRWYLDGRSGLDAYARGHVRDAVFVDLDAVLAAPATPEAGRHPLPDPEVFAHAMGGLGISNTDRVVAYDDAGGATAARLAWMLRAQGSEAAILDGGISAWPEALSTVVEYRQPRRFRPRAWPADQLADSDDTAAAAAASGMVVIDARADARYRGEIEPVDERAGHIPGAVNVPFDSLLNPDGRLLEPRFLEDKFRNAGVGADTDVVVYCGSGVTACAGLLVLEQLGFGRQRLYPGSWSQWSADPTRPAKQGHLR